MTILTILVVSCVQQWVEWQRWQNLDTTATSCTYCFSPVLCSLSAGWSSKLGSQRCTTVDMLTWMARRVAAIVFYWHVLKVYTVRWGVAWLYGIYSKLWKINIKRAFIDEFFSDSVSFCLLFNWLIFPELLLVQMVFKINFLELSEHDRIPFLPSNQQCQSTSPLLDVIYHCASLLQRSAWVSVSS